MAENKFLSASGDMTDAEQTVKAALTAARWAETAGDEDGLRHQKKAVKALRLTLKHLKTAGNSLFCMGLNNNVTAGV